MALQDVLYVLDNLGFTDVFLPFILIFTIVFATLQKIKMFGEESRKFNAIISMALAIGVIIPHSLGKYPPGTDIVDILNTALPSVSLTIIAITFILILVGMFGGEATWGEKMVGGAVTFIAVGLVVFIFGSAAGWWQSTGIASFLSDPSVQATILVVAVFWLIISTITKGPQETAYSERVGQFFGKAMSEAAKKEGGKKEP